MCNVIAYIHLIIHVKFILQTAQQQQQMVGGGIPPGGGMVPVPVAGGMAPVPVPMTCGPITLNPEQLTKLNTELDVVQQNCKVFNEMLTEMTPGQEDTSDLELLQVSCRKCSCISHS